MPQQIIMPGYMNQPSNLPVNSMINEIKDNKPLKKNEIDQTESYQFKK